MTWVKFCGMRSVADVRAAVAAGADAVGFVTAAGSVREVSIRDAAAFGEGADIERYLVTRDVAPRDLVAAAAEAGVTGVQPHGKRRFAAAEAALAAGLRVLYPIGDTGEAVPSGAMPIIDGPQPGSGIRADLAMIRAIDAPFVLAGGLTPDNVGDICAHISPYGVDVSSGIERERGIKDPGLMEAFMGAVR